MKSTLMDSVQAMSNTGKHIHYLAREILPPCYEDESLNTTNCESYENSMYLKWLSATYGKTGMARAEDWLMTKKGR